MNDFRVEQTYDQIQQLVRDAAESVLRGYDPDPPNWHDRWVTETAARIAEAAMLHMDAAEAAS
jgi:hypothetical protein